MKVAIATVIIETFLCLRNIPIHNIEAVGSLALVDDSNDSGEICVDLTKGLVSIAIEYVYGSIRQNGGDLRIVRPHFPIERSDKGMGERLNQ